MEENTDNREHENHHPPVRLPSFATYKKIMDRAKANKRSLGKEIEGLLETVEELEKSQQKNGGRDGRK